MTALATMKRHARALLAALAALTLIVTPALAMRVSPMVVEMESRGSNAVARIEVQNINPGNLAFQTRVFRMEIDKDGNIVETPADQDFLVFPPQGVLPAGGRQVVRLQWVGGAVGDPDILRRVYHSSQMPPVGFNRGRFNNPEVDRLIDLATVALTEEDRRMYYSAVQKLVAEEAVYIPIWSRINAVVARPGVSGVRINPIGDFQALAGGRKAVSP